MTLKRASLEKIARQVIDQTPEVRAEKMAALGEAIKNKLYRVDADDLSSVVLALNDVNSVLLMSLCPCLISEHLARYERNSRYWPEAAKDTLISLQIHDHFTGRHSARMTAIAVRFAHLLGLPPNDLEALKIAGYFHDLGKITINQSLLIKAGTFTADDRAIIENHPLDGGKILEPLGLNLSEKEIILHHHERWDGGGYPSSLVGEDIPYLCRLVALADTFEALTSHRPYRPSLPTPQALAIIDQQAAAQFDPDLTHKFTELVSCRSIA